MKLHKMLYTAFVTQFIVMVIVADVENPLNSITINRRDQVSSST